jgi:hypothetical protein
MRLARTWSFVLQSGIACGMVVAAQAGAPIAAAGRITWTERALDLEGPFVRALGTDADGDPVRLLAVRCAEGDPEESTFVFVQDGRPLVVEQWRSAGEGWLSVRFGRDRLVLERFEDSLLRTSTLRYTLPDGSVQRFHIGAGGEIEGDRAALRRAFDRNQALLERATAFVAAIEDPDIAASLARAALPSSQLEFVRISGKISKYSRCVDECTSECTLQCGAECNLGILDPAGILCGLCKTSCLAGCSAGCVPIRSRE